MPADIDSASTLREAALRQPGAVVRDMGIKFQCPACRREGFDGPQDNAILFNNGKWGCAWAKDTELGLTHWNAIGDALGAFRHCHGTPPSGDAAPDAWADPETLPSALESVPDFEPELLPAPLRAWVLDIAERTQCPIDFVAVGAIISAASVVGRRIGIYPKAYDDWLTVPNLWGVAVGPPGIMKTPALEASMRPLYRLVANAKAAHKEAMPKYESLKVETEIRRNMLKKDLELAIKSDGNTDGIRRALEAATVSPPPTEHRYLVNDATVEKLGELLNQNPNGLLLYRDELLGFLRMMEREGHQNDRAFYCEAWAGTTARYTYDRIGRGTIDINTPCLCILGGMTPGPLQTYLRAVFRGGVSDDGFFQRFQLAVYPNIVGRWKKVDRWPDTEAKARASRLFRGLAALDAETVSAHRASTDDIPALRFTSDAQVVFDEWQARLENRLRSPEEHPVLVSHLSKYRSLLPSLGLLFHLMDCADRGTGGPVQLEPAKLAVEWCTYLEAHARRIYQSVTDRVAVTAAVLAAKLKAGKLASPFRARDVYRAGWTGLMEKDDILSAVDLLERLHWLRSAAVQTSDGGRPTTQYTISPKVRPRPS